MKTTLVTLTALLLCAPLARAATEEAAPEPAEKMPYERLTREMTWYTDLDKACADAKADHKLVFWVQILGQIDGPS